MTNLQNVTLFLWRKLHHFKNSIKSNSIFQVLLLIGASAATAVALHRALRWVLYPSVAENNSLTEEKVIDVKSELASNEENKNRIKVDLKVDKTNLEIASPLVGNTETIVTTSAMASVKDKANKKHTNSLVNSLEEDQTKKCSPSWSEMIEEDISQVRNNVVPATILGIW